VRLEAALPKKSICVSSRKARAKMRRNYTLAADPIPDLFQKYMSNNVRRARGPFVMFGI